MKCHVYRSSVKEGLYVYVAAPEDDAGTGEGGAEAPALAALPAPVRRQLGRAELAMTLELTPERTLGQEDVAEVLANLAEHGFHVQMPRDIEPIVERIAREATRSAGG